MRAGVGKWATAAGAEPKAGVDVTSAAAGKEGTAVVVSCGGGVRFKGLALVRMAGDGIGGRLDSSAMGARRAWPKNSVMLDASAESGLSSALSPSIPAFPQNLNDCGIGDPPVAC